MGFIFQRISFSAVPTPTLMGNHYLVTTLPCRVRMAQHQEASSNRICLCLMISVNEYQQEEPARICPYGLVMRMLAERMTSVTKHAAATVTLQ